MRIAFCHHLSLSYYGGGEKWVINVAKELTRRGHEVEIYALPILLEGKPKINPNEALDGIPYNEGFRHKVKADVTYITYNPLSWLNFQTSKPKIAGIHSESYWTKINPNYGTKPNLANLAHKVVGKFELKRYDAVHMVTDAYKIDHPNVYYIPNFVDAKIYKSTLPKDDVFTIAYSSRMVWQKGWGIFQAVVNRFKEYDLDFKFKVSANKIKEADMPKFLSSGHVALLPSEVDTFGLSIVEALLCETPVISTPLTTHKSLNLPLIYGDSVEGFVDELRKLWSLWAQDKGKYYKLANNCRQQALKYDKEQIMDKLEAMLMEVCRRS